MSVLVLSTAACQPSPSVSTGKEIQHMKILIDRMTPRCVGRYLIDLPEYFVLNSESRARIEDVTIRVKPMERALFESALERREEELRAEHMDGKPSKPSLKATIELKGALGKIFNRARKTGAEEAARTLELRAWRDGYAIEMEIEAEDYDDPKYRNDPLFKDEVTTVPEKLDHLRALFERVRGRDDQDILSAPGVCIPNGFVKGAPSGKEAVSVAYHLDGANDVYFRIYSDSGLLQDTTLLERASSMSEVLKLNTLRKGRKETTSGLPYEEWLMALETWDRIPGTEFTLEVNGKTGSAETPLLIAKLFNGTRIPGPELSSEASATRLPLFKATFNETEAMALWDAVAPTIRPRPGAFSGNDMAQQATMPQQELVLRWPYDGAPVKNRRFEIVLGDGTVVQSITDEYGRTGFQRNQLPEQVRIRLLPED